MSARYALFFLMCPLTAVGCKSNAAPPSNATDQFTVAAPKDELSDGTETAAVEPTAAPLVTAAASEGFVPPATRPGENGWEMYVDPPTLTSENVTGLKPGNDTPEAAVAHFYASRIQGDKLWEQVLVSPRSKRLERKLSRLEKWKFLEFRLVKRKARDGGGLWMKIHMVVEINGKQDSGTDDVGLVKKGDEWFIESVPT